MAPPFRRRDAGRSTHAGNRRRCKTTAVGLLRRRSGEGAARAMAGASGNPVFPGRAACAPEVPLEAGERGAARAPMRGDRGFPTSAAKWLAHAAGHGALGPGKHSLALQRHLAALSCFGSLPGSRSRYIPASVKREVWRRDQGCCSYVDPRSRRRCGSRYRLEIDHIVPFALGGGAEPGNLRLRCAAHHRLRHGQGHSHPASVPAEALRAPVSAVDPVARGGTVGPHAAIERPGHDRAHHGCLRSRRMAVDVRPLHRVADPVRQPPDVRFRDSRTGIPFCHGLLTALRVRTQCRVGGAHAEAAEICSAGLDDSLPGRPMAANSDAAPARKFRPPSRSQT